MKNDASGHAPSAVPDDDGILVTCACGWQVWSRTRPTADTLELAERQIGGAHLADVNAPPPPRHQVQLAIGLFVFMVCVTAVAVYLIVTL